MPESPINNAELATRLKNSKNFFEDSFFMGSMEQRFFRENNINRFVF